MGASMIIRAVIPIIVVALSVVACSKPAPPAAAPGDAVAATSTSSGPPAATGAQSGQSGATLDVDTAGGSASYTVGNWRPVPLDAQIIPAKGVMYSVDVRIVANTGTVAYNGFFFVARTADGSTVAPAVGAVRPGITSGQLSPGQSVEGHVAFDFAPGTAVTGVMLRDPAGKQKAFWSVS
jgi:hypothetical protein